MPTGTKMDIDENEQSTVSQEVLRALRQDRTEMAVDDTRSEKERAIDLLTEKMIRFNRPIITQDDLNSEQRKLNKSGNPHRITIQEVIDRGLEPLHNDEPLGEKATSVEKARHKKFVPREVRRQEEIARTAMDTLDGKQVHAPIPQEILDEVAEEDDLSAEQRKALRTLTNGKGLAIMRGPPGTGKGRVLGAVTKVYRNWAAREGKGNLKIVGAGPTHMVAQKFGEQGIEPENRKTIHKVAKDDMMSTVLEGDEAGMYGTKELHRVVEKAARPDADSVVLLVGDEKQLASPEYGGMFKYAINRYGKDEHGNHKEGYVELTENHRQKVPWQKELVERVAAATNKNRETEFKEILKTYAVNKAVTWVPGYNQQDAIKKAVAHIIKARDEGREILGISRLRADVKAINRGLFEDQKKKDELADEHIRTLEVRTQRTDEAQGKTEEHEDVKFGVGTPIQFLGTFWKSPTERGTDGHILNGAFATIVGFEEYSGVEEGFITNAQGEHKLVQKPFTSERIVAKLHQKDEDGVVREVRFDPKNFKDFDQGFASTIQKVQGQDVRGIVYVANKSDGHEHFNVATSRNTHEFHMIFRQCDGSDEQIAEAAGRVARAGGDRSTSLIFETEADHLNAIAKANQMDIEFPTPQASAEREKVETVPLEGNPAVSREEPVAEKPAQVAQDDIEMASPEIVQESTGGHGPVRNLMDLDTGSTPTVYQVQDVEMKAAGDHEQTAAIEALRRSLQGLGDPLAAPVNVPDYFARTIESFGPTPSESAQPSEHTSPALVPLTNSNGSFEMVPLPAKGIESLTNSLDSLKIHEFNSDEAFNARLKQRSENRKQIAKEVAEISATQFARTVARIGDKLGLKEGSMSESDKLYVDLLAKRQQFRERSAAYAEDVHARVSAKVEKLLNPAEVAALKADIDAGKTLPWTPASRRMDDDDANDRESYKSTNKSNEELTQATEKFAKLNDRTRETAHRR